MRKVIKGAVFDTAISDKIGEADNLSRGAESTTDFEYWEAALYRTTRKKKYFLAGKGGPMSRFGQSIGRTTWAPGEDIIPISPREALEWAEKNLPTAVVEYTFADLLEETSHPLVRGAVHPWWNLTDEEREEVSQRIAGGEVVGSPEQKKDFFFLRLESGRTVQGVYSWDDSFPTEWALLIMGDE